MTKDDRADKDDVSGAAAFTKIARGLSDLFTVLSDFEHLPRRGRHEKDGKVFEYSFGTRTLREAAGEEEPAEDEPLVREAPRRREPKRTSVEVLEPVMDMFDEPDEILFLFELPGIRAQGHPLRARRRYPAAGCEVRRSPLSQGDPCREEKPKANRI